MARGGLWVFIVFAYFDMVTGKGHPFQICRAFGVCLLKLSWVGGWWRESNSVRGWEWTVDCSSLWKILLVVHYSALILLAHSLLTAVFCGSVIVAGVDNVLAFETDNETRQIAFLFDGFDLQGGKSC